MKYPFLICMALSAGSVITGSAESPDFSNGVFIVNEDWYGHQNSTVNWISDDGEWSYRVFQAANAEDGRQLGCTNQYGQIYGGRFFLIAKQDKDPGANTQGGRITVADARTMEMLFQSALIDPSGRQCDGRAYLGVDEHKGYISSSNGVWVFDTDNYKVTGQVKGTANPTVPEGDSGQGGSLYQGQCGSMVRVNERVFVAHQEFGLLVVDPGTDEVTDIISMQPVLDALPAPAEGKVNPMPGIGSVVLARDGSLWVSVAKDTRGTGDTLPFLMRVDPVTLDTRVIPVPDSCFPPANSWYAWTPDGFCASTQENSLYWNGGPNSWFSNSHIYKYNIDTEETRQIVDFDQEASDMGLDSNSKWSLYGCSMRIHPVSDELYMSLFHKFQDPTYILRKCDSDGKTVSEYPMIQNYWFPSIPVFPDNFPPEAHDPGLVRLAPEGTQPVNLDGVFTDRDNMEAAIVKTVVSVSDPDAFSAKIVNGNLAVTPLSPLPDREYSVEVKGNSNGETAVATIRIAFSSSGLEYVTDDAGDDSESWYGINGQRLPGAPSEPGVYIRIYKGTPAKVIVK